MNQKLRLPPEYLLACPNCGADVHSGLDLEAQACSACNHQFFDLAGMPCWFAVGQAQRTLWESLYGLALQQAERNFALTEQAFPKYDLLPSTRARAEQIQLGNRQIIADLRALLDGMGLEPKISPEFADYDASRMLQYFELLLRDWAWDPAVAENQNENALELARVQKALAAVPSTLGHTLVLGAGAGRLSWDIQCHLQPESTIALDTNPVLISAAHRLVALQQPWQMTELPPNPQAGKPEIQRWQLKADPATAQARERWFAVAANAWRPPFKNGAFDTVITPWFIDVNGKDVRTLIAQVQKLLKPGGLWINTGPLLYGSDISPVRRYTTDEIVQYLALAGFEVCYQSLQETPYLKTPLSAQLRTEQVWTFVARAPELSAPMPETYPPAWIILPHLPIPVLTAPVPADPVLQHLAGLVDGKRSVNDIAQQLAPKLGKEEDPVALVQTVFMEYLLRPEQT